jgi:peptidoglycan hydrolase CwlO-like protein
MPSKSLPERVSALEDTVTTLERVPKDLAEFRAEFQQLHVDVKGMDGRVQQLYVEVKGLNGRFERLEEHIRDENDRLYSRMRTLHEDLISRLQILGERSVGNGPTSSRPPRKAKR